MKTSLLHLLLIPLSVFSQKLDFVKNDTLLFNNIKYPTVLIKIGNDSRSNPAMVFVTDIKNFNHIKKRIPEIYFSKKQEYTDYYLIGIKNLESNQDKNEIVTNFLIKIDNSRIAKGLYVLLKNYDYNQLTGKITYLNTTKSLKEVSNLYYLFSEQDICKYMICRK